MNQHNRSQDLRPVALASNQPRGRFYEGGSRISEFRGEQPSPANTPEDWIASTTSVRGEASVGLTVLPGGTFLADAIAEDPLAWLGSRHVDRYGADSMLLFKLLDAGQRLPVHVHPDGNFAAQHVGARHGKAEAWYILAGGSVHLGLKRSITLDELGTLVENQDAASLLEGMWEIPVEPGDSIFVPPGMLHAIGSGVLLAEVQEPEDLSILLEWSGFDIDGTIAGHLGIGFDVALAAVDRSESTAEDIDALVGRGVREGAALPVAAAKFFRLDRVSTRRDFTAGFAIVVALASARLTLLAGPTLQLDRGSTTLIPFASGSFRIDGDALVARPPAP
jgi:mannose-6-phosphate isomerase